jgi:hypothetical protein
MASGGKIRQELLAQAFSSACTRHYLGAFPGTADVSG